MVSKEELTHLLSHHTDGDCRTLSVYLDVDQSKAENLNRGFQVSLKNLLRSVADTVHPGERKAFTASANQIERFVREFHPEGKTLVLFSNADRDFFWHRTLRVANGNEVYWYRRPYIRPLIEAQDEFERYGVILTDRAQARLFTITMGEIEEDRRTLAEAGVRRFESTGRDHIRSQMVFQRKAEEHAKSHLKNVAGMMDRMLDQYPFDRLIIAGPTEAVADLKNLLTERLKERFIGTISLPLQAHEQEILHNCLDLVAAYERANERAVVEQIRTGAGKKQQAVLGLADTTQAVAQRRVRTLVYAEGYRAEGSECTACGHLFEIVPETCSYCGGPIERVPAFLERLIEQVTQDGGAVEVVREDVAETMRGLGGIGALLRF